MPMVLLVLLARLVVQVPSVVVGVVGVAVVVVGEAAEVVILVTELTLTAKLIQVVFPILMVQLEQMLDKRKLAEDLVAEGVLTETLAVVAEVVGILAAVEATKTVFFLVVAEVVILLLVF